MYYRMPLPLDAVLKGNELPVCDLAQSIAGNLELLILTRFGEHRSDPSYGCEVWDLDFELIVSASLWEEKLRRSLLQSVVTHEHRLTCTVISIAITDIEKFSVLKQITDIRKRVDIGITGTIQKTGEAFRFSTNMFLSPLSLD